MDLFTAPQSHGPQSSAGHPRGITFKAGPAFPTQNSHKRKRVKLIVISGAPYSYNFSMVHFSNTPWQSYASRYFLISTSWYYLIMSLQSVEAAWSCNIISWILRAKPKDRVITISISTPEQPIRCWDSSNRGECYAYESAPILATIGTEATSNPSFIQWDPGLSYVHGARDE